MTTADTTGLRARIEELERENADLKRQVVELRDAVAALMAPDAPRIPSVWNQFGPSRNIE